MNEGRAGVLLCVCVWKFPLDQLRREINWPNRRVVCVLFYSAAGEASLTGSIPQPFDQRSVYNKTGHMTCVSHGKTFWDFLGSEWSLRGVEGQFPVSADSGNKERLFCTGRCPDRDSTRQIWSQWLQSLLLKTLCALYFTHRARQESRWELLRRLYGPQLWSWIANKKNKCEFCAKKKKKKGRLIGRSWGWEHGQCIASIYLSSLSLFWLIGWSYVVSCGALCILLGLKQILN